MMSLGKFFFIIILILSIFISSCRYDNIMTKRICFEENCFFVEVADSNEEREIGLMNRNFLESNKGMLFVFEKEGIYSFWMKDTLIPLDIIWINSNKEVVFIKENALPCKNLFNEKISPKNENCETFVSDQKTKYVLEVNSRKVKELGIKIGEKVEFN